MYSNGECPNNYPYKHKRELCKNIFVVCANHEKKKKNEMYFTMDNQNISVSFTAQLASYFVRDGLFFDTSRSLELMVNV